MVTKKDLDALLNPPTKPKAPTRQERLHAVVTPLWDLEMGQRLRLMRMMLLLDQTALGNFLGLSQRRVSDIENGHMRLVPVTIARLEAVFGDRVGYILLNSAPERFSPTHIYTKYLETKRAPMGDRITNRQGIPKYKVLERAAEVAARQAEHAKREYERYAREDKK